MGSLTLARAQPDSPLPLVRRFLHPLAARNSFYYPLVLAPLYLTIGPWFVGNVLSESLGKNKFCKKISLISRSLHPNDLFAD